MIAFWVPGVTEMLVIGGISLLIFGKRLPEVARGIGSSVVEFKKGLKGVEDETGDILGEIKGARDEAQKQIDETKKAGENILK